MKWWVCSYELLEAPFGPRWPQRLRGRMVEMLWKIGVSSSLWMGSIAAELLKCSTEKKTFRGPKMVLFVQCLSSRWRVYPKRRSDKALQSCAYMNSHCPERQIVRRHDEGASKPCLALLSSSAASSFGMQRRRILRTAHNRPITFWLESAGRIAEITSNSSHCALYRWVHNLAWDFGFPNWR